MTQPAPAAPATQPNPAPTQPAQQTQPAPAPPQQGQQPYPPQPGQGQPATGGQPYPQPSWPQQGWPQPYPGQVPPYGQPAPAPYGQPPWQQPAGQPLQPGQVPGQQPQPTGQPQPGQPGQPPAPWTPPTPFPGVPAGQAPTGQTGTGQSGEDPDGDGNSRDLSSLPQWAQQQITKLRQEAADRRVAARTATVGQHAYQVASQAGVNPQALLGSTAWQQAAAQLDPAAPDYGQRLQWTVQSLLAANPWMAAQQVQGQQPAAPQAPPSSGGEFAGGSGAGTPISEAQLAQMTPDDIAAAYEAGRLKHLM